MRRILRIDGSSAPVRSKSNGKLLVIPYSPSGWRYFGGQQPDGLPIWQTNEPAARPLVPFGMFDSDPANIGYEFHKCLGYFATGASLTGVTVRLTVATLLSVCPSLAL